MLYRNVITKKIVEVIDSMVIGDCKRTKDMTFVVFKGDKNEYPKIMENREFHANYEKNV